VRLGAKEVGLAAGVARAHQQRIDIGTCSGIAVLEWAPCIANKSTSPIVILHAAVAKREQRHK
jgi:hypothetical protein